jgi:hypothetical protein
MARHSKVSVRVPQVRYSEPVLSGVPRGTGSEYRTRGTRKLDRDVTLVRTINWVASLLLAVRQPAVDDLVI